MLNSPLITVEDQRPLRDELVRELAAIERDFGDLQSRNTMEISAKLDIAKSALRERVQGGESWLIDLIDSIQSDLHTVHAKASSTSPQQPQRPEETPSTTSAEASTSSAA